MSARAIGLAVAVAATLPAAAGAQDGRYAEVEACIRENAPRVERAFESLIEATQFLTGSVCLESVAEAAEAERAAQEERRLARLEEICAEFEDAEPIRMAGNPVAAQCQTMEMQGLWMESVTGSYSTSLFAAGQVPAEMTGLAATLLLEARLASLGGSGR